MLLRLARAHGVAVTHEELCERARRWLSGTRKCEPVFSNIGSCSEIPDAIGWSSRFAWSGSTVVECKTSASDFYAERKKYWMWEHPEHHWRLSLDRRKRAQEDGYKLVELPRMGDYRFYFCEPGIISAALVEKHAPDHGLVWVTGSRRVQMIRAATRRTLVDKDGEIRYLRFAIINNKAPFAAPGLEFGEGIGDDNATDDHQASAVL